MLSEILQKYLKIFPDDIGQLGLLLDQIKKNEKLDDRRNFRGILQVMPLSYRLI